MQFRIFIAFVLALFAFDTFAQGPDAELIKGWLSTPVALFVLMLAGSAGSIIKQMNDGRLSGTPYTFHWPETLYMLGGNVAGFLVLLMADQLNFAAVIFGGYTFNSVASISRQAS